MTSEEGEKTPHWSYFGKDGIIYTGWHYMGKNEGEKTSHLSYFGADGWLRTGWQQMGKGTGNTFGENQEKHWSYFGGKGWLQTGWKYLTKSDGEKTPHWSYFGRNGWLRTGLQSMGTSSNPDGNNKQHLSYFGENGWLVVNKIFTFNKKRYMADAKGWATSVNTEDEKILLKAKKFIENVTDSKLSKEEKFKKCYNYIQAKSVFKSPWIPHYRGNDWPQKYADNYFDTMSGNCFSYAAALGYVARAMGYENVYCCNGKTHGWVEINGLIYDTSKGYRGISYTQKAHYNYKGMISAGESWMRVKI